MNKFKKENAEIGARIQEIRMKRNMTQEVLAEKANICNPQQMSNIERGMAGVSLARFKDICRVLNVGSDYLLFGISSESVETEVHKYMEKMTREQLTDFLELARIYAKACGIV